jgi:hypothetical protein
MYPKAPAKITAAIHTVGKSDVRLHVSDDAVHLVKGVDVALYNVYFEVVPAANAVNTIQMAAAPTHIVVKPWGAVVGAVHEAKAKK